MGLLVLVGMGILCVSAPQMAAAQDNGEMTVEEAYRLGEEFGLIVEELDEEISKELRWEWQGRATTSRPYRSPPGTRFHR